MAPASNKYPFGVPFQVKKKMIKISLENFVSPKNDLRAVETLFVFITSCYRQKKTTEIVIYDMSHRQSLQIWSNFFV